MARLPEDSAASSRGVVSRVHAWQRCFLGGGWASSAVYSAVRDAGPELACPAGSMALSRGRRARMSDSGVRSCNAGRGGEEREHGLVAQRACLGWQPARKGRNSAGQGWAEATGGLIGRSCRWEMRATGLKLSSTVAASLRRRFRHGEAKALLHILSTAPGPIAVAETCSRPSPQTQTQSGRVYCSREDVPSRPADARDSSSRPA